MIKWNDVKAGDIIKSASGTLEYAFDIGNGEIGLNACNESWINRGLRGYGEECYPISTLDLSGYSIAGHEGNGSYTDGNVWYDKTKR